MTCIANYTASDLAITEGQEYIIIEEYSNGDVEILSDSGQSSYIPSHMIRR